MSNEQEKWKPSFKGNEPDTFRPSHYHNAPCDVIELQGYVTNNCYRDMVIPAVDFDEHRFSRLWAIGAIVKHICRMGLKDHINIELRKIENYAHYARTGEWLEEKQ